VYLFDRSIIESTVAMVIQFGLLNNKRYYLRPSRLHNIYYTKQTLCPWAFVRRSTSPPPITFYSIIPRNSVSGL